MKLRVFVVDDDRHYARLLSYRLERNVDHDVRVFHSGEEALDVLDEDPHLVLLDIMMPGIGGIETLRRLREKKPDLSVVMVSAQGVVDTAVEAMKLGAYDYITKGQDELVKLDSVVRHVRERVAMEQELSTLRKQVKQRYSLAGMIGESQAMGDVYRLVEKALRGDLTVAIQGESGTGKELVAKAIHFNSTRKRGPFVVVNCAAIPRDLMESEFFGHEKGSFTGAHARKIGKFEQADGGTIFLDEIGELDLDLQAKLLRALQSREIQRVGGNQTITFDARVISATNRDVIEMIRAGTFREDLYYRLFQFPITIPPLRERSDDVLLLADFFLRDYVGAHQEFKGKKLSVQTKRALVDYAWPGNVRELKSAVERAILISDRDEITVEDLMLSRGAAISPWANRVSLAEASAPAAAHPVATPLRTAPPPPEADEDATAVGGVTLGEGGGDIVSLEDIKQQAVERAYRICEGNVDRAAVELGIGRATMYRLLKKYGLMA